MPRDSRDAALTGRAFACARVRDTAAAAGGKGQHADIFDGRQAGQLWDALLNSGFVVRGSGSGVDVMQGRGRERGVMRGGEGSTILEQGFRADSRCGAGKSAQYQYRLQRCACEDLSQCVLAG